MAPFEPRDGVFVSQRLRLHYVEWGDPAAPPVILIHGGRDHCRSWDASAANLSGTWRVIAPDLRGHGASAWTSHGGYEYIDFIFDLAEMLDALGLSCVPIVGHSFGGGVAWRFAALYPERVSRLVLIEGLTPLPRSSVPLMRADILRDAIAERRRGLKRAPVTYPSVERAAERMHLHNPRLSRAQALHLTRHGVRANDDGSVSFRYDPAISLDGALDLDWDDKTAFWRSIGCPVLLIYGGNSHASDPAKDGRAASFANASVEVFDGAGHWVHHDDPAGFGRAVSDFLGS